VITACLESFSHGSNDTANASAAFSFIYDVYATNGRSCADSSSGGSAGDAQGSPAWILAVAGFFVAMGVVLVGHRVIATMGSRLVHVSFQRGWCIEFSSAATVLLASVAGLPISSTHCQVLLSPLSPLSANIYIQHSTATNKLGYEYLHHYTPYLSVYV
jgi:phosphate/sulfate permease